MDPVKVAGVMEWPILTKKKDVQFCSGFVNFYCRFIKGFSHYMKPLFELTKKDHKWIWGKKEQWVFNELKNCITSYLILHFADNFISKQTAQTSQLGQYFHSSRWTISNGTQSLFI
jgi:hypothetical protein